MKKVLWIAAVALCWTSVVCAPASADVEGVFKEAWTCAKSLPQSAYTMAKDVKEKGEAVANMSASVGVCTAQTGGQSQVLAFVTTVLGGIKASKPDLLPNGQCKARIHAQVAKPFALGVATVLPESSARAQLLSLAQSEQSASWIWSTMKSAPPPFGTIPAQVDCGCDLIDGGIAVSDISAVSNVIRNTSKSCAGILDEAGLGFVNDWGSSAIAWTGSKYTAVSQGLQKWQGKKEAAPDEVAYQAFFGVYVQSLAEWSAVNDNGNTNIGAAWAVSEQNGGWAAEAVGFCTHPMTFSNVCMIRVGDMHKKCVDYFNNVIDGDKLKDKCNQWHDRAATAAAADAKRLRLLADSMTLFRLKLDGWLDKEWVWRLPRYNPTVANNVKPGANGWSVNTAMYERIWPLGEYEENKKKPWNYAATGIYAQARDALVNASYDQTVAHQAAMAGAYVSMRDTTLAVWNAPAYVAIERKERLGQWMPAQPFSLAYGCHSGPLGQTCVSKVEAIYDAHCHSMLRDAYVLSTNVLNAAVKVKDAKQNCVAVLTAIVTSAEQLTKAGLLEVQAKAGTVCPQPTTDRSKASQCLSGLSAAWDACAKPEVGNVFASYVGNAKTCFESKAKAITSVPLQPIVKPKLNIPPGGWAKPRTQ